MQLIYLHVINRIRCCLCNSPYEWRPNFFHRNAFSFTILIISILFTSIASATEQAQKSSIDLSQLTLEQLMNLQTYIPLRKYESLAETPAAIYVITADDMERCGYTNIPDALRLAPGMEVARIDANKWAISARGFNGVFSNKLLVLIDGRAVYTPLFSGVFWEAQDVFLQDLAQIEIIRGSGATLWGANAVNGIINVITRDAKATQGGLVTLGVGSEEREFGGFRYGGQLGQTTYYRVYAKYFKRDNFVDSTGAVSNDAWNVLRAGFRIDSDCSCGNLTLQGDIYAGDVGQKCRIIESAYKPDFQIYDTTATINGANILGRWEYNFSPDSDVKLKLYYDFVERKDLILAGKINTLDFDFQHRFTIGYRQEIIWGLGYRFISDVAQCSFYASIKPDERNVQLLSAFIQDELTFLEDRLRLTIGSKFERNEYTGFEIQPNVRLLGIPHNHHYIWGAISRAVRMPSRFEMDGRGIRDVRYDYKDPFFGEMRGSHDFKSEELVAYELGYRCLPINQIKLDLALFYNVYNKLRTYEERILLIEEYDTPHYYILPIFMENKMKGKTHGAEITLDWQLFNRWRLHASYTYLEIQVDLDENNFFYSLSKGTEGESPKHQFYIRPSFNLLSNLQLDLMFRYVDKLPDLNVDSYYNLDFGLRFKPFDNLEVSVAAQNLLSAHQREYFPAFADIVPSDVERGLYCSFKWQF